ncbi:MAG: hypothetical protein A4E51_01912 [Methanosaeta sp. PtaU1.Bin055]|nr:MAG: hypothetical protein A4E51_01912 [Methanosaeta sp. PtaU1.Bin055]
MISCRISILVATALALAAGQAGGDYLDPSGGPSYSEWRSYFSDPIFFSGGAPSRVDYSQYYPYFGSEIFRTPASLGGSSKATSILGKVARELAEEMAKSSPSTGNESASALSPRYRRMINPETLKSSKNWTRTMEYATNRSSVKVFEGGEWTEPRDVQKMY